LETREILSNDEHNFGEWIVIKTVTCIANGEQMRICSYCAKAETDVVPAIGQHAFSEWIVIVEASCSKDGQQVRVCPYCTTSETAIIPATGEHLGEWITLKAASCTEEGEEIRVCTYCNISESREIPMLSHNYVNDICTECGDGICKDGHSYEVALINNPARFNKTWGICTVCGYIDDNHEHAIQNGKCVYCDYELEFIEFPSTFDNDNDGNLDVFYFSHALPEKFTGDDVIWVDAFNDALKNDNHTEYDEIRAGSGTMPYPTYSALTNPTILSFTPST
jgi:hypothetical protein